MYKFCKILQSRGTITISFDSKKQKYKAESKLRNILTRLNCEPIIENKSGYHVFINKSTTIPIEALVH